MIALLGNLALDLRPGQQPQAGGGPIYGARALQLLGAAARVYARCAEEDREALFEALVETGVDAQYVPGRATTRFEFSYEGEQRTMVVGATGDVWQPGDVPSLPAEVGWVHVAPLLRSDFPAPTLAAVASGRSVLLDGQGLVRVGKVGPLVLDADYDPEVLRHLTALKLADEEAEVLGDPVALKVPEVIVTHGSRGVTVYFEGRAEHVSADPSDGDPTGAGDSFCCAYVAGRAAGLSALDAAQSAVSFVSRLLRER